MKYIRELKTGTKYLFMPQTSDPNNTEEAKKEMWGLYKIFQKEASEHKALIGDVTKENVDKWFDSERKCLVFENLEYEGIEGFVWSCWEMLDANSLVLSVRKNIENSQEIFKVLIASTLIIPHMDDRKFGLEDSEIDNILDKIEHMPENYRKMLV